MNEDSNERIIFISLAPKLMASSPIHVEVTTTLARLRDNIFFHPHQTSMLRMEEGRRSSMQGAGVGVKCVPTEEIYRTNAKKALCPSRSGPVKRKPQRDKRIVQTRHKQILDCTTLDSHPMHAFNITLHNAKA